MDPECSYLLFCPPLPPLRLSPETPVAIGRHPSCELTIQQSDISRRHAQVSYEAGSFVLIDLGSTNGSFVNGEPLEGIHLLQPGDRIEIGSSTITFCQIEGMAGDAAGPGDAQTMILNHAPAKEAFHGDLAEIPPFAVFQVLEMGSKTGLLTCDWDDGSGRIWFGSGRPIHAESEKCEGFDAAILIAMAKHGRFRFEAKMVTHEPTIEVSVTEVLLEACRIQDENEKSER